MYNSVRTRCYKGLIMCKVIQIMYMAMCVGMSDERFGGCDVSCI